MSVPNRASDTSAATPETANDAVQTHVSAFHRRGPSHLRDGDVPERC